MAEETYRSENMEYDEVIGVVLYGSVFSCLGIRNPEQFENDIRSRGGRFSRDITKNTDYLVIDPVCGKRTEEYENILKKRNNGDYPYMKIISVRWLYGFLGLEYED